MKYQATRLENNSGKMWHIGLDENDIAKHVILPGDPARCEMIAKYFERIGDHAANIAEWVEFSITGIHEKLQPEGFQRTEEQREEK